MLAQPSSQKVAAFRPLPQNAMLGQGPRSAARNHPRSCNAHAMGHHPCSLIAGCAQRPYPSISLRWPLQGSHKQPRRITPPRTKWVGRDTSSKGRWGGRPAGPGRRARPCAGLPALSVSHHATGSPMKQVARLTATGSLGAVGGAARQCTVACSQSLKAQQVSPPMI